MSARPLSGRDLPRVDAVPHPPRYLLHNPVLRTLAQRLLERRYDIRVSGGENLPRRGPAVVAANHIGWLDGPLLGIVLPRPVHALTKLDMFTGRTGRFLRQTGQIPLDRFHVDPAAVKAALRVLAAGNVVGVFPEGTRGDGELHRFHRGAGYLALASGAPVVPVVLFGTRLPGGASQSRPPAGSRIDIVVGPPVAVRRQPWPRTREQVEHLSRLLQEQMREHLDAVRAASGLALPGPLPPTDREPDPATALSDHGSGGHPDPSPTEEHDD
jgi:1-acyl-sn-glycerol-3-phosphate acyltransferase